MALFRVLFLLTVMPTHATDTHTHMCLHGCDLRSSLNTQDTTQCWPRALEREEMVASQQPTCLSALNVVIS